MHRSTTHTAAALSLTWCVLAAPFSNVTGSQEPPETPEVDPSEAVEAVAEAQEAPEPGSVESEGGEAAEPEEDEPEEPFATLVVTSDSPCHIYVNGVYLGTIFSPEEPLEASLSSSSVDLAAASTEVSGARFTPGEEGIFEVEKDEVREFTVPLLQAIEDFKQNQRRTGTWIDLDLGLMWPRRDNAADVTWVRANEYCESLSFGGFEDWRLPAATELEALEAMWSIRANKIVDSIFLSACCTWSATAPTERTAYNVDFRYRRRFETNRNLSFGLRALCVRNLYAAELEQALLLADPKEQKRRLKAKRRRQDERKRLKAERAAKRAAQAEAKDPDRH